MIYRQGLYSLKVITRRNRNGTNFSMLLFVLHHAFWELCLCLYLRFPARLPELRVVRAIVLHALYSPLSFVSPRKRAAYDLEYFATCNPAKWTSSPAFYHSIPAVFIAETIYELYVYIDLFFFCELVRHFDHPTVLYHSTATSQYGVQARARSI